MVKVILFTMLFIILFSGCKSREYKNFIKKYGSESRTFCEGRFLMRETYMSPEAKSPQLSLINSQKCTHK